MEDSKIIELYNMRSEEAIAETKDKYGKYLNTVAYNILYDALDAEECEQDTYVRTWNAIPPAHPSVLRSFLAKITRNLALDRYEKKNAEKRGAGNLPLCLDELSEVVSVDSEADFDAGQVSYAISSWLSTLERKYRRIFVRRYFYMDSIKAIAEKYGYSESKVKTALFRMRNELKKYLENEGIEI